MEHFSYSLFVSLAHSLWQAALLLCMYLVTGIFIKNRNPLYKRNILFFLLLTQFVLTLSTFFIYYSGSAFYFTQYFSSGLADLISRQSFVQMTAPWFIMAYTFIIIYKASRLAINWQRFRANKRSSWIKPPIDLKLFTTVKANQFGIRRKVGLWYSNVINTPVTFGTLKPVILLPVALVNNLSISETETLIIHELTHIKSNDYFFNWLLIICEILFFFNPFIKVIVTNIKMEREKNCDTRVLQFNYPALGYAETLLKTARFKSTPAPFILAAVFKHAQLIKRIRFFTDEKNLRFNKKNYTAVAVLPLITVFILNILLVDFINHKKDKVTENTAENINAVHIGGKENFYSSFPVNISPLGKNEYRISEKKYMAPHAADKNATAVNDKTPVILSKENAEFITDAAETENLVMPVVLEEQNNTKEIILKEENSATGKTITKVYQMRMENGEWKATLLWTITEGRPISDSLPYLRDTTAIRHFNEQQ